MTKKLITANMATIPERIDIAYKAMMSMLPQVDKVRIYFNNMIEVPPLFRLPNVECVANGSDLNASGKFFWAKDHDEFYFAIDDDIVYPPDYVDTMLDFYSRFPDRKVAISMHGKIMAQPPVKSYFKSVAMAFHCLTGFALNCQVHIIGTGVSLIDTGKIKINVDKFDFLYMDDIEVSKQCQLQGVDLYAVGHKQGYFGYNEPSVPTLYEQYHDKDDAQTKVFNSLSEWKLKHD